VRAIDQRAAEECGLSTLVLMENAGHGAAAWLRPRLPDRSPKSVVVVCGSGNNGGDGGVVARHLDGWGIAVRVIWFAAADQLRGDAAVQWSVLERAGIAQENWTGESAADPLRLDQVFSEAEWIVDGLLGTGLTRPVEGTLRAVIEAVNRAGKPVLALDLPSGLDTDTGKPLGIAVHAAATATFVAAKLGFQQPGAGVYTGEVVVIDIGVPRSILAPFLVSTG
jgi:NAD(P)H-hydrate epimerase